MNELVESMTSYIIPCTDTIWHEYIYHSKIYNYQPHLKYHTYTWCLLHFWNFSGFVFLTPIQKAVVID